MKIAPYSDLHIEMYHLQDGKSTAEKVWAPTVFPDDKDETILCLGGDIWYGTGALNWIQNNDLDRKFKAIVIILGNHEYWYNDLDMLPLWMREMAEKMSNVHFLHNETKIVEGVRFIGGPLWTDFDNEDPLTMLKASYYMNDYAYMKRNSSMVKAKDILELHKETVRALEDVLVPYDGKTVVMTHHLPSWNFIDGKYRLSSPRNINAYYAANCDRFIEDGKYDVWMYGHTHDSLMLKYDTSTIVCNPKGYGNENRNFLSDLRIDLNG